MTRSIGILALAVLVSACSDKPRAESPVDPATRGTGDESPVERRSATSHGEGIGCDEAMEAHEDRMGQVEASPETEAEVKKLLNEGSYLNRCKVLSSASVEICAAILDGAILGVTIEIDPGSQGEADCVAAEVRKLTVPESAALIRASTQFAPSL